MEPRVTVPGQSPEVGNSQAPEVFKAPETNSEQPKTVEQAAQPGHQESKEAVVQSGGGPGPQDQQQPAHALPILPKPQVPPEPALTVPADDNPLVAADEDLVEKEWVDKAKKIVNATKDDPYNQEKQVSKLQADYLKKRYGKEVKLGGD